MSTETGQEKPIDQLNPNQPSPVEPPSPLSTSFMQRMLGLTKKETSTKAKESKSNKVKIDQPQDRKIIVLSSNFTGDVFGIFARMICDNNCDVLLLKEVSLEQPSAADLLSGNTLTFDNTLCDIFNIPKETANQPRGFVPETKRCKADQLISFFKSWSEENYNNRVFILPTPDITKVYGFLTVRPKEWSLRLTSVLNYVYRYAKNTKNLNILRDNKIPCDEDTQKKIKKFMKPVTAATSYLGHSLTRDIIVPAVREIWLIPEFETLESLFNNLLGPVKEDLAQKKFIVIWSRFSGKNRGPHPQHTTSFEELRQLITLANKNKLNIILAGDTGEVTAGIHYTNEDVIARKEKSQNIAKEHVVWDLREIWKTETFRAIAEKQKKDIRILQLNLMDYINRKYDGITHIGWRSGNLEAYCYLGHRVYYMEEHGNMQSKRAESLHSINTASKIIDPKKMGYNRITVELPSTQAGKFAHAAIQNQQKGDNRKEKEAIPSHDLSSSQEELPKNKKRKDNELIPWHDHAFSQIESPEDRINIKETSLASMNLLNTKGLIPRDETRLDKCLSHISTYPIKVDNRGYSYWDDRNFITLLSPITVKDANFSDNSSSSFYNKKKTTEKKETENLASNIDIEPEEYREEHREQADGNLTKSFSNFTL